MLQNNKDLFREKVTIYSFILTILVVWIHAVDPALNVPDRAGMTEVYSFVQGLLGSGIGQIAVPGFFCLSGYLFFRNADVLIGCDKRTFWKFFTGKWKSRFLTIVVPYILWNLIYFCIYLAAGRARLDIGECWNALILYKYNPVFWYLLELIMITAVTPLIYLCMKKKQVAIAMLAAVFLAAVYYDKLPIHFINEDALFYYMTGVLLALHYKRLENSPAAMKRMFGAGAALFLICEDIYIGKNPTMIMYGIIGGRIAGVLGLFALVSILVDRNSDRRVAGGLESKALDEPVCSNFRIPDYMNYNFFIYAVHYLELRAVYRVVNMFCIMLGGTGTPILVKLIAYIVMPFICVAISVIAARVLIRFMPKMYTVLTGGRGQ